MVAMATETHKLNAIAYNDDPNILFSFRIVNNLQVGFNQSFFAINNIL